MHKEALQACEKLKEIGFELDVSTYTVAIYAFGSIDRIYEILKMFMRMKTKGLNQMLLYIHQYGR